MVWVECGKELIEADVIRWSEPVWKPSGRTARRKPRKAPVMIGRRTVTGQVQKIDRNGWVHVSVAACVVEPFPDWWKPIPAYGKDEIIRRQRGKIGRGKVERLLWSEEEARTAIVSRSRFLNR
ncbi:hypothetical protein [Salipiger marinus]|uniref:hypothetical protein n=1 Tax=Salipiger marinus TaxID=555512 RepID=UPI000B7D3808|nr:hypothetical protein [Salipiger marinus]